MSQFPASGEGPISIYRLTPGEDGIWRDAVQQLVPVEDREGHLLSIEDAEAWLSDERCYLIVASDQKQPVGLLSAFRFPDVECGGVMVYLYDIEVQLTRRREGIGQRIVEHLRVLCNQDEVDLIWAGTETDNKAARRLFESTSAVLQGESYAEYEWDLETD